MPDTNWDRDVPEIEPPWPRPDRDVLHGVAVAVAAGIGRLHHQSSAWITTVECGLGRGLPRVRALMAPSGAVRAWRTFA